MAGEALKVAKEALEKRIGTQTYQSVWFEVDQDRVDRFADVTMDHQWIHVDPERSKKGPFGGTIAHGHLTLSIMECLPPATAVAEESLGATMVINYGFDRVRFPAPVPVGSRIRTTATLKRVEEKKGMIETMNEVVVEVEGQEKPACVAEGLARYVF